MFFPMGLNYSYVSDLKGNFKQRLTEFAGGTTSEEVENRLLEEVRQIRPALVWAQLGAREISHPDRIALTLS